MNDYKIREMDNDGNIVAERHVNSESYEGALRQVNTFTDGASIVEVYDASGEKIGGTLVEYWLQRLRRRR